MSRVKQILGFEVGDTVTYTNPSDEVVNWGNNADPRGLLDEAKEYVVEDVEIHSWHSKVKIKGFDGWFNSVSFKPANKGA